MNENRILVIAGPTAVGKTEYAIEAARAFNGEIVSCDSMQLYKYMDIGSAKPSQAERGQAEGGVFSCPLSGDGQKDHR